MSYWNYILVDKNKPDDIKYVGYTNNLNNRLKTHKIVARRKNKDTKKYEYHYRVYNWIRFVWSNNSDIRMIKIAKYETQNEAYEIEQFLIGMFKKIGYNLTNLTDGGPGCSRIVSDDEKIKHSIIMKNRWNNLSNEEKEGYLKIWKDGSLNWWNNLSKEEKELKLNKQLQTCEKRWSKKEEKEKQSQLMKNMWLDDKKKADHIDVMKKKNPNKSIYVIKTLDNSIIEFESTKKVMEFLKCKTFPFYHGKKEYNGYQLIEIIKPNKKVDKQSAVII